MASSRSVSHAIFFALYPDSRAAHQAIHRALASDLVPTERLHVSLVGLCNDPKPPPEPWLAKVMAAGDRLRHPSFLIELTILGSLGRSPGRRQAVALQGEDGVIGVHLLCDAILAELRTEGFRRRSPEIPHLTISYSERFLPPRPIDPVCWTACELLLIHSVKGAGRHEVLARWPLARADASKPVAGGH